MKEKHFLLDVSIVRSVTVRLVTINNYYGKVVLVPSTVTSLSMVIRSGGIILR